MPLLLNHNSTFNIVNKVGNIVNKVRIIIGRKVDSKSRLTQIKGFELFILKLVVYFRMLKCAHAFFSHISLLLKYIINAE